MYLPLDTYVSRPATRSPPPRSIRPADRDPLPPPRSIELRLPHSPTTWSVNSDLAIRSNPIRPCPGIRISPMKPSCQSYTTLIIRILHASFRYTIGKLHANRLTTRVNRSPPLSPAFPRPNSRFPLLTVTTCHRRLPSRISVEDAIDT